MLSCAAAQSKHRDKQPNGGWKKLDEQRDNYAITVLLHQLFTQLEPES